MPQNGVIITKLKNLLNFGFDAVSNFEMNEALNTFRNIKNIVFFSIQRMKKKKKINANKWKYEDVEENDKKIQKMFE